VSAANINARNTISRQFSGSPLVVLVAFSECRTGGQFIVANASLTLANVTTLNSASVMGLYILRHVVDGVQSQLVIDNIECTDRDDAMTTPRVDPGHACCIIVLDSRFQNGGAVEMRRITSISTRTFGVLQLIGCHVANTTAVSIAADSSITLVEAQPRTSNTCICSASVNQPFLIGNTTFLNASVTLLKDSRIAPLGTKQGGLPPLLSLVYIGDTAVSTSSFLVRGLRVQLPADQCGTRSDVLHVQNITVTGGASVFNVDDVLVHNPMVCSSLVVVDWGSVASSSTLAVNVSRVMWRGNCSNASSPQCLSSGETLPFVSVGGVRLGAASRCSIALTSSVVESPSVVSMFDIQASSSAQLHADAQNSTLGVLHHKTPTSMSGLVSFRNVTAPSGASAVIHFLSNASKVTAPSTSVMCLGCSNVAISAVALQSTLLSPTWQSLQSSTAACMSIANSTPSAVHLLMDGSTVVGGAQLMLFDRLGLRTLGHIELRCSGWARHSFSPLVALHADSLLTPRGVAVLELTTSDCPLLATHSMSADLGTTHGHSSSDLAHTNARLISDSRDADRTPTARSFITRWRATRTASLRVGALQPPPSQTLSATLSTLPPPRWMTKTASRPQIPVVSSNATNNLTLPKARISTTKRIFSSMQVIGALASILGVVSIASSSPLIRTAFMSQLANCNVLDVITGGGSVSSLLPIDIGTSGAPGHGYRSTLAGLMAVMASSVALGLLMAVLIRIRSRAATKPHAWRDVFAFAALPGWWLSGPCAASVAPILSGALSLASVSDWASAAGDGALVAASFAATISIVVMSSLALLRPRAGGWFVGVTQGGAPSCIRNPTNALKRTLRWLLDGGHLWQCAPKGRTSTVRFHPLAFGDLFVPAYGSLFESMRPDRHWYPLLDMSISIAAGMIAAIPAIVVGATGQLSDHVCSGALHTMTAVQLLAVVLFLILRPPAVRWERLLSGLMYVLAALSAVIASIDTADGDETGDALDTMQLIVSALLIGAAVAESILVLIVFHRRRHIDTAHDVTTTGNTSANRCLTRKQRAAHYTRQEALRTLILFACKHNYQEIVV
jgi:hypothetical protein